MLNVAVFVGSLRRESVNRKLARALEKLAEGRLAFAYPDLDLPLYNDDLWEGPLPAVHAMKDAIAAADGVLFVTPEYNRSLPPVLKNAIDWASRPWGQNSWDGKPVGIVARVDVGGAHLGLDPFEGARLHPFLQEAGDRGIQRLLEGEGGRGCKSVGCGRRSHG